MNQRLAITCGDPAGIGPEIVEKWVINYPELASQCAYLGPQEWLDRLALGSCDPVQLRSIGPKNFKLQAGSPSQLGAKIAWKALQLAADGCLEGVYSGVVTCPTSKIWMQNAGFNYPGQTEFFESQWPGTATMGFIGNKMRVILGTWHIPLTSVAPSINLHLIERTIKCVLECAYCQGFENPRIGICGLNPHAGEGGILGKEELTIIDPILDRIRKKWPKLSKCLPADTLFWRHLNGDFDYLIAWYHDQALSPVKAVDFESSVNITLGLKYVRTSPCHGTAFDLAGLGKAQITSFTNAVRLAQLWVKKRSARMLTLL